MIVRGPGGDVANWPVTTTIRVLDFNSGGIFVDFAKKDGPDRWPDVVPPGWEGEQVGFFVTAGDQRAKDVRLVTEHSNVVVVPFPSNGGAYYPF